MHKQKTPSLICFVGIDGAGKTTSAKALCAFLAKAGVSSKYVWHRYDPLFAKPLIAVGKALFWKRSERTNAEDEQYFEKIRSFLSNPFRSEIYYRLILADFVFQTWIRISLPLLMGTTVVCDRYIEDTIVDLIADYGYPEQRIYDIWNCISPLIPKSKVVFLMDIDEKTATVRKAGIPMAILAKRRETYLRMCKKATCRMILIDGNKGMDDLNDTISNCICGVFA